jgi:hypothetical protein
MPPINPATSPSPPCRELSIKPRKPLPDRPKTQMKKGRIPETVSANTGGRKDNYFTFPFSLLFRDRMAPTVRFIFRAIAGAFIPEASSLRSTSSSVSVQGRPAGWMRARHFFAFSPISTSPAAVLSLPRHSLHS